jgi:hypothetical protein
MRVRITALVALILILRLAVDLTAAADCDSLYYRGFDTRLEPALLVPLPPDQRISSFEVWKGHPVLASESDLLLPAADQTINSIGVGSKVQGVVVDNTGRLSIRTPQQYWLMGPSGLIKDELLSALDRRIVLLASGTPSYLAVGTNNGVTALSVFNRKGLSAPLFTTREPVVAASWSPEGLAAIAGTRLIVWDRSSSKILTLRRDDEFAQAQDVILLPSRRAIICLPKYVLLVGEDDAIIIAGFRARARYQNHVLYLLDATTNFVWKLSNIESVGTRQADLNHAARLLARAGPGVSESDPQFLEAARILGCQAVRQTLRATH